MIIPLQPMRARGVPCLLFRVVPRQIPVNRPIVEKHKEDETHGWMVMRISSNSNQSSVRRAAAARGVLSERASTLIEVLVAGMLLIVVAASLYGTFSSGFYLIQSTREN